MRGDDRPLFLVPDGTEPPEGQLQPLPFQWQGNNPQCGLLGVPGARPVLALEVLDKLDLPRHSSVLHHWR